LGTHAPAYLKFAWSHLNTDECAAQHVRMLMITKHRVTCRLVSVTIETWGSFVTHKIIVKF